MNLPIVPITDLAIKNGNLIAATQGRSLWILDDLDLVRKSGQTSIGNLHLFKPIDAIRMPGRQNKKAKGVGMNPTAGAKIQYHLKSYDDKDTVKVSFHEADGTLIKELSNHAKEKSDKLEVEQGLNTLSWDLRYPEAKKFEGMILWWGSMAGAKAVPGKYSVKLRHNDQVKETEFNISPDPRLDLKAADYQSQFEFTQEVNNKVTEAHETIIEIRSVKKQLAEYKTKMEGNEEIVLEITKVDSLMSEVEKNLYQTKNRSRQDPLNFPIKLTNKLAHLNSLNQISDEPPTAQAITVKDELVALINEQLTKYKEVVEQKIPSLNRLIKSAEVDAIFIKKE